MMTDRPGLALAVLVADCVPVLLAAPAEGIAVITSGAASANAEARPRRGELQTMLRADHPVFGAFMSGGKLAITVGEHTSSVEIDRANLSKLRRFAELCTG